MTSKIRVLDEHTINQIAAGEVIESSASVIKELVENSVDAGSTEICVEISGGGRQLIRVTDNGSGMTQDDALLCLERHATSKIRHLEDITTVATMGFRGEAIPSIASISKFTLITCPVESEPGTMVVVEGGKILQCCPVARSSGTTIEVKSLFYNVPVRRKFQKSPAYDSQEILKVISQMALSYPCVQFQLINDQKMVLSTLPSHENSFSQRLGQRIQEVLGNDFYEHSQPFIYEEGDFKLEGFIGVPSYTRHNRTGQYLFLNQRAIQSPLVSFAVRDGYGTSLPSNRHPIYVLHLSIPGSYVDVNVHPQKREVRLRREPFLREKISQAIHQAFQQQYQTELASPFLSAPPVNWIQPEEISSYEPPKIDWSKHMHTAMQEEIKEESKIDVIVPLPKIPYKHPIQILGTMKHYILCDALSITGQEGICLIDQKAAHARIIFEKLIQQTEKQTHPSIQTLLVPIPIQTTLAEAGIVISYLDFLNQMGISIHQSGPSSFLVDAIPSDFNQVDIPQWIARLIEESQDNPNHTFLRQEQIKKLSTAASRASISQDKQLSIEEGYYLVEQLMRCQTPAMCPKGERVWVVIATEEIKRKFWS